MGNRNAELRGPAATGSPSACGADWDEWEQFTPFRAIVSALWRLRQWAPLHQFTLDYCFLHNHKASRLIYFNK